MAAKWRQDKTKLKKMHKKICTIDNFYASCGISFMFEGMDERGYP
jgi:hypothetical protein